MKKLLLLLLLSFRYIGYSQPEPIRYDICDKIIIGDFKCPECIDALGSLYKNVRSGVSLELNKYQSLCTILNRDRLADILKRKDKEDLIAEINDLSTEEKRTLTANTKARRVIFGDMEVQKADKSLLITLVINNLETGVEEASNLFEIPYGYYDTYAKLGPYITKGIEEILFGKKTVGLPGPVKSQPSKLVWLKHSGRDFGYNSWVGAGTRIGTGLDGFVLMTAAPNGVIYGVKPNGDLIWMKHTGFDTGADKWAGEGKKIAEGWNSFIMIAAAADGVIYGVKTNGELIWNKHLGKDDGSATWQGNGSVVGRGWTAFTQITAAGDGIIYAVKPGGELMWYNHTGKDTGTFTWADNGKQIGTGWNMFTKLIAAGTDGVIYGILPDGQLNWYKHTGRNNGTFAWLDVKKVAEGWDRFYLVAAAGTSGVIYGLEH